MQKNEKKYETPIQGDDHLTHLVSLSTISNHSYPHDLQTIDKLSIYNYQWLNNQSNFKTESKHFQLLKPSSLTWRADLPIEKNRRFINLKSFPKADNTVINNNIIKSKDPFMRNINFVAFTVEYNNKEDELSQSFINEVKKNDSNEINETTIKELKTNLAHTFEEEKVIEADQLKPDGHITDRPNKRLSNGLKPNFNVNAQSILEKRNKTKSPIKPKSILDPNSNRKMKNNKTTFHLKPGEGRESEKKQNKGKERKIVNQRKGKDNKVKENNNNNKKELMNSKGKINKDNKQKADDNKEGNQPLSDLIKKKKKEKMSKQLKIKQTSKEENDKSYSLRINPKQVKQKQMQNNPSQSRFQIKEQNNKGLISNGKDGGSTAKNIKSPPSKTLLQYTSKPVKKSLPSTCLSKTRIPSSNDTRYALHGKTFCVNSSLNDFNNLGNNLHKPANLEDISSNIQQSSTHIELDNKGSSSNNKDIASCSKLNSFELRFQPQKIQTKNKIDLSSFNNDEEGLKQQQKQQQNNNNKNIMRININEQYAHLKTIINTNSHNMNSTNNNRDFDSNVSTNKLFNSNLNQSSENKGISDKEEVVFTNIEVGKELNMKGKGNLKRKTERSKTLSKIIEANKKSEGNYNNKKTEGNRKKSEANKKSEGNRSNRKKSEGNMRSNKDFDKEVNKSLFIKEPNKAVEPKIEHNAKEEFKIKGISKGEVSQLNEDNANINQMKDSKTPISVFNGKQEGVIGEGGFLKRICSIIDSKIKELSFNELSSYPSGRMSLNPITNQKKKWREEFSQTYTLYFPQYSKKLMSNITQKHFNNKMNFYKQICHNPFNPYSPNFDSEKIISKNINQEENKKHISQQDLPVIQNKKLLRNNSDIDTLKKNRTQQSFFKPNIPSTKPNSSLRCEKSAKTILNKKVE